MTDKPYQPTIDKHGVGWCSGSTCPYFSHRPEHVEYCKLHGHFWPKGSICEPWAIDAAKAKAAMDKLLAEGGMPSGTRRHRNGTTRILI